MSKPKKGRRCYNLDGHKERMKGKENEDRFYCAFCSDNFEKPRWLKKIRPGTSREDRRGIDFVAETYTKPEFIFIQIKSSKQGKVGFWRKHSPDEFRYPMIVFVIGKQKYHRSNIRKNFFDTVHKVLKQI